MPKSPINSLYKIKQTNPIVKSHLDLLSEAPNSIEVQNKYHSNILTEKSIATTLEDLSIYWSRIHSIQKEKLKSLKLYHDIECELKSYDDGTNTTSELPLVSNSQYPLLAKHFKTLPERQIEESFKLIKTFHILNNYYLINNITCVPYDHFFNHLNIIYHGYNNKQAQTELEMLESYGDDIKMHLTNPSGTVRIFEVFQQILVTNSFQGEYLFYPKLSPGAGDVIVKNNLFKSYGVGELKSGALPKNNIIKLFTKMIPQYSHLNHIAKLLSILVYSLSQRMDFLGKIYNNHRNLSFRVKIQ